jgi:putative NADH-flavin reductase
VVVARSLLTALEQRPSLRVIVVGGAASLEVASGLQAVDSGPMIMAAIQGFGLPEGYTAVMEAHREAMNLFRLSDRNWSYLSPAIITLPGERTGRFRLGGNQPVMDADGQSRISYEDLAVALLDEVEIPTHLRQRFTIGY